MQTTIKISFKEAAFLVTLLRADRQTALQLLAAEHLYMPSLLPQLDKAYRLLKSNTEPPA